MGNAMLMAKHIAYLAIFAAVAAVSAELRADDIVAENPLGPGDDLMLSIEDSAQDSQHATWGTKKNSKDAWETTSKAAKKAAKDAKKLYKKVSSTRRTSVEAENPLGPDDDLMLSIEDSAQDSQHATWGAKKNSKDAWETTSKA